MEELCQGQRWMSESEPELGLGVLVEVMPRQVVMWFPASQVERRYTRKSAPLRRIRFRVGDLIENRDGRKLTVTHILEQGGVLLYEGESSQGSDCSFSEVDLNDLLSIDSPEERLRLGQWDSPDAFVLRQEVLELQSRWFRSPVRGLLGGRIERLPHQFYIADEVSSRLQPRVLLADETGLGKTIEACLILHRLLVTGRVERCLILLPEALLHQWFVELLRRFQLVFQIVDKSFCEELALEDKAVNPFTSAECVISSLPWLASDPKRMAEAVEAGWDFIIVDEAHHIRKGSASSILVGALSEESSGTLLLTATPEQQGAESHFARLKMLDPARYTDYDSFVAQNEKAEDLAQLIDLMLQTKPSKTKKKKLPKLPPFAKDWLKKEGAFLQKNMLEKAFAGEEEARNHITEELLDRYGPGRVMFRNTRMQIEGFPKRLVHCMPFVLERTEKKAFVSAKMANRLFKNDPRLSWLVDFLTSLPTEKVLLMGGTQREIVALEAFLRERISLDIALFHEGLTLLQRDRQAVWFSEPEGAQLMLCSSIGGEGRNFQCARHLVFFDIPENPEILEQHIGRLDRIGQADEIELHVPYIEGSSQEVWVRWYEEGLGAFAHNFSGGFHALEEFRSVLVELTENFWFGPGSVLRLEELLSNTQSFCKVFSERREKGRNRLLELSSFEPTSAGFLLERVKEEEQNAQTRKTIFQLFDAFGVEIEPFTQDTWKLHPGIRLDEDFPWLQGEPMMVTFAREEALERATYGFVSLDHPMVSGAMELLLGGSRGRCCVADWTDADEPCVRLECVFVVECVAPQMWGVDRFLPPTPYRIVVNHLGGDETKNIPASLWKKSLKPLHAGQHEGIEKMIEMQVPKMVKAARRLSDVKLTDVIEMAQTEVKRRLQPEIDRITDLRGTNPSVTEEDVERLMDEQEIILLYIEQARVRLDGLRLVFGGDIGL